MFDTDLSLVAGIICLGLAVPSGLNGWTEGRLPKFGLVCAIAGLLGLGYALTARPTGYTLAEVPEAFARVFAQALR